MREADKTSLLLFTVSTRGIDFIPVCASSAFRVFVEESNISMHEASIRVKAGSCLFTLWCSKNVY